MRSEIAGAEEQRAHRLALEQLCKLIYKKIMSELDVEMISTIRECYLFFLQKTDFYNPEYCTRQLKEKRQAHYGEWLALHFEQHDKDEIVYSNSISVTEAIEKLHNSSSTGKVKAEQAAMILRRTIKQAFKSSEPIPWPHSAEFLFIWYNTTARTSDQLSELSSVREPFW